MVKRQAKKRTQQQQQGEDPQQAGQGSCGRHLLTKVTHSIHPVTIYRVLKDQGSCWNVLDPLVVQCSAKPKVSLQLAFDLLVPDDDDDDDDEEDDAEEELILEVRDVDAPNVTLQIEATVEWYKRSAGAKVRSDRAKWPAPEPPVQVTLDGEGRIGSFKCETLRALTVHLEVYSLGDCTLTTVLGGLNALRREKTLSDVELKVDGEVFPAHRAVLAANSPVLCSMFTSGLKEAQEGVVDIEGTSSTAFSVFLEFLYSAKVDDWKGCEVELFELADRYLVAPLKAICEERLLQMDWSMALRILQHTDKPVISSEMRVRAMQVVAENWDAVHVSPRWEDFVASTPVVLADSIQAARNCLLKKP